MGWKSTMDITRQEAIHLIREKLFTLEEYSNKELEDMLEKYGFGDDRDLPYYGYNFNVVNETEEG